MSEIIQYMVKDPQGNVYGPAPMDTIRQWIREGRITAAMQLAPEGTPDWRPAAAYTELQDLFAPDQIAAVTGQRPGATPPAIPTTSAPVPTAPVNPYAETQPLTPNYETPGLKKKNPLATASLICGIVGLAFFCPFCCMCGLGFPADIAAIVLGFVARGQIAKNPDTLDGDNHAKMGMILGIIGLALTIIANLLGFFTGMFGGGAGGPFGRGIR